MKYFALQTFIDFTEQEKLPLILKHYMSARTDMIEMSIYCYIKDKHKVEKFLQEICPMFVWGLIREIKGIKQKEEYSIKDLVERTGVERNEKIKKDEPVITLLNSSAGGFSIALTETNYFISTT